MNIFDDGCHQAILDAARQPIDKSSDGYVEGFSASDDTTQARRLELASGRTTKPRAARRIIHFKPQISVILRRSNRCAPKKTGRCCE